MKPLAIDLYCGLGGWTEGLLAESYDVVGFDVERHDYGPEVSKNDDGLTHIRPGGYPAQLVLQDVLTLHGSQFRNAALIVASPPCQAYSYRAMPWKRAKALPPPSNELFDACFRIQREASEAAGRHIPLVVENVRGAQPWVGRAAWHYGSFYLWGDVPALMPVTRRVKLPGHDTFAANGSPVGRMTQWQYPSKNAGGSWFAEAHNTESQHSRNPVTGEGVKQGGSGAAWFDKALDERRREATAIKNGADWFGSGENCSLQRRQSSRSDSRKAASAQIAKIPFELARWIAYCYR